MTMARNKFAFLATGVVLAMALTLSCSNDDNSSGGENSSSSENNLSDNSCSSSLNSSSSLGALSSSSSSDGDVSLDGTWLKPPKKIVIEGSKVTFENFAKGAITYDNSIISFSPDTIWYEEQWWKNPNQEKATFNYALNNNILTISGIDTYPEWNGEYTKGGNTPFDGTWQKAGSITLSIEANGTVAILSTNKEPLKATALINASNFSLTFTHVFANGQWIEYGGYFAPVTCNYTLNSDVITFSGCSSEEEGLSDYMNGAWRKSAMMTVPVAPFQPFQMAW